MNKNNVVNNHVFKNKKLRKNAAPKINANKSNVKLRRNKKLNKKCKKRQLIERKIPPFAKNVKPNLQH